jgi:RNA recognition motif-containing protein
MEVTKAVKRTRKMMTKVGLMRIPSTQLKPPGKRKLTLVESSDESEGSDNDEEDEDDSYEEKVVDYSREKDLASKVLERVMASSKALELDEAQPNKTVEIEGKQAVKGTKSPAKETKTIETTATVKEVKKSEATEPARKNKKVEPVAESSQEDGLKRTVFVRNLPLEAKVQDLRRQFSDFGEVKSFRLVLHPITKYALDEYLNFLV